MTLKCHFNKKRNYGSISEGNKIMLRGRRRRGYKGVGSLAPRWSSGDLGDIINWLAILF